MSYNRNQTLKLFNKLVSARHVTRIPKSNIVYYTRRHYSSETSDSNKIEKYDVVVIGAGPAGMTLATALKSSPYTKDLKSVLIEGSKLDNIKNWNPPSDFYENRVISLTPRSVGFLKSIGAWEHINEDRVKSYDEMIVWDGLNDNARIDFTPDVLGENTDIAYMIEIFNLQHALYNRLQDLNAQDPENTIDILDKSRVKTIYKQSQQPTIQDASAQGSTEVQAIESNDWPIIELESGKKFQARLLVGADGANSPARAFAGIESHGWNYNTHGLVATLELEWEDFRSVAFQRFLKTGPIAMLPLPDGFASLVWSCTPDMARKLKALSPKAFCTMVNIGFRLGKQDIEFILNDTFEKFQLLEKEVDLSAEEKEAKISEIEEELQSEFDWRLANVELVDEDNNYPIYVKDVLDKSRASFPLKMKHADTYVAERVALVGDAAHSTHPLAGQGLNMGQQDVESLVKSLETATKRGLDIGSLLAIEPYWSERYFPNHLKLGVVDKLHKLYSSDFGPLVQLRSWGLNIVNGLDIIKKELMKQASN